MPESQGLLPTVRLLAAEPLSHACKQIYFIWCQLFCNVTTAMNARLLDAGNRSVLNDVNRSIGAQPLGEIVLRPADQLWPRNAP